MKPREVLVPMVFDDHDGFTAGVPDGEPSACWPDEVCAHESWFAVIQAGGPPLYGVPIRLVEP